MSGEAHDETKISYLVDKICADTLERLIKLLKPFKYVIDCAIMQKNGAGLNVTSACFWDTTSDGIVSVKWPEERQKGEENGMYCIVTVFACAI